MAAVGHCYRVWYLIGQFVGAGQLLHTLVPQITYHVSIIIVGILIILYCTMAGMNVTTWIRSSRPVSCWAARP